MWIIYKQNVPLPRNSNALLLDVLLCYTCMKINFLQQTSVSFLSSYLVHLANKIIQSLIIHGYMCFYLAGVPWAWEDLWHRCGDTLKHWQGEGNPLGTSFWFLVNVYHQEVSANNKISTQNCLRCNYVHVFNVHC